MHSQVLIFEQIFHVAGIGVKQQLATMLHRSSTVHSYYQVHMQLGQWALRHRFSARLQRRIRYQPPPSDPPSQSRASVSAPSSWQRASTEANKNLEATAPRFSRPSRTAFSRSAAAPPQREAQGRYLFGTPCIAAAGMSSYVSAQYLVPNHASPGICPGSI